MQDPESRRGSYSLRSIVSKDRTPYIYEGILSFSLWNLALVLENFGIFQIPEPSMIEVLEGFPSSIFPRECLKNPISYVSFRDKIRMFESRRGRYFRHSPSRNRVENPFFRGGIERILRFFSISPRKNAFSFGQRHCFGYTTLVQRIKRRLEEKIPMEDFQRGNSEKTRKK